MSSLNDKNDNTNGIGNGNGYGANDIDVDLNISSNSNSNSSSSSNNNNNNIPTRGGSNGLRGMNKHLHECEAKYPEANNDEIIAGAETDQVDVGQPDEEEASDGDGSNLNGSVDYNSLGGSDSIGVGGSGGGLTGGNNLRDLELGESIFRWFIYSIFATLFLLGTSTNALTLYAVGRKRTLAPMDIYIIMLAINDLIYCIFALPIPPLYVLYYGEWVFGRSGCKMVAFLTSFSVHNSSMTVVNIAHLRFRLVVHPFEPKVSNVKAYLRSIVACLLATIITIPYVLVVNIFYDEACLISCDEYWGEGERAQWRRFLFSLFTTTVQFLLPLIGFEYYYKPVRDKLILLEKTHSHAVILKEQAHQTSGITTDPASSCSQPVAVSSTKSQSHHGQKGAQLHQMQLELSEIRSSSTSCCYSSALALNQLPQPAASSNFQNHANSSNNNNNNNSSTTTNNNNNANKNSNTGVGGVHLACGSGSGSATTASQVAGISSSERERIRQMNLLSRLKQTRKVVYFFSFTWLPLNVCNLLSIWIEGNLFYVYAHLIVQATACCSVCLNPIMYPLSNDNYRQEFEHILPVCLLRKLDSLLKA